jgi:hypothetical protein
MSDAEARHITIPEWLKVVREANLATSVHLGGLSVELRQLNLRIGRWIRDRDVESEIKLILKHVVNAPCFAEPACALFVRLDSEEVVVVRFVYLHILRTHGLQGRIARRGAYAEGGQERTLMSAAYSSFSRSPQSGSRGPAFTVKSGIFCIVLFVPSSCTSVRDIMPSLRLCQRKATIHANGTDHLCSASPVARAAE